MNFQLPLVDQWIKFTATSVGRDKLYRLFQYFSKIISYSLEQRGYPKEDIERWVRLSSALGLGRKLFRIGKPIDFVQTALKSLQLKDDVIRYCAFGRSCFLAGWLTLDAIQWFNANGIVKVGDIKWVNTNAARCWFIGLLFAVFADSYRLRNNLQRIQQLEKGYAIKKFEDDLDLKKELISLKREHSRIVWELFQDSLDVLIPASILNYISVSQGFVGSIGTITSVMGIHNAWPK